MEKIYKSKISKEDFKTIMSDCFKPAWITYSKENFMKALQWKNEKKFEYFLDINVNTEDDWNASSSTIDLFETYAKIFENQTDPESIEKLKQWNESWSDPNGFELDKFAGEQIEDGNAVGEAARTYYTLLNADHNLKNKTNFVIEDYSDLTFDQAVAKTQENLANLNVKYMYEAAFEYDQKNFKTRCDILKLKGNNHVEIIEIKATSTVKIEYVYDLMYQIWVLEKCGLIVDNVYIGHLAKNYLLNKEPFERIIKEEADEFAENFGKIEWAEVKPILAAGIKVGPTTENLEVDLQNYFKIDPIYKTKKNGEELLLFNIINEFRTINNLDHLMTKYTEMFARDDEWMQNYLDSLFCATSWSINRSWKWENKNDAKVDGYYCGHVVPWFDKSRATIWNMTGMHKPNKAKIYRMSGLIYLDDIKSLDQKEMPLNDKGKQIWADEHYRIFDVYKKYQGNNYQIDWNDCIDPQGVNQLQHQLDSYANYPIYMYDFETVKWALPKFEFSKGYQQIPFQYSVDIIVDDKYDYNNPSTMDHMHFIGEEKIDPRPLLIEHLLTDLFKHGPGVYVAYNKSFEQSVCKYLAFTFPEYAKPLLYIAQNTIDLMHFFKGQKADPKKGKDLRNWFLIYHPAFAGSYSIKKTQPALDATFSYNDLEINNGGKASQTFRQFIDGNIERKAWDVVIKPDMIKYCNRDTLAMVVILKRINEIFDNYLNRKER